MIERDFTSVLSVNYFRTDHLDVLRSEHGLVLRVSDVLNGPWNLRDIDHQPFYRLGHRV